MHHRKCFVSVCVCAFEMELIFMTSDRNLMACA